MAIKNISNFSFVDLGYYVPSGIGKKNNWFVPRVGIGHTSEAQKETKIQALRTAIGAVTRAEIMGMSFSSVRMIEDKATRPQNMRTLEHVLVCKLYNSQANARGSMVLPPVKDSVDIRSGSADMVALADAIKANCSLLIRTDANDNDVPCRVTHVEIFPRIIQQTEAADAPTVGIDEADDEMTVPEQIPAVA